MPRGQRVAHLVDGAFRALWGPGRHGTWTLTGVHEFLTLTTSLPVTPILPGDPLPDDLPGCRILDVAPHERVAVFVHGTFAQVLERGRWRWWDELGPPTLLRIDRRVPPASLPIDDPLPASIPGAPVQSTAEPALLLRSGRPVGILPPGRYRCWELDEWRLGVLPRGFVSAPVEAGEPLAAGQVEILVAQHERVVVMRRGVLFQVLGGGRYVGWEAAGPFEELRFDTLAAPTRLADDDPLPPGSHDTDWVEAHGHDGLAVVLVRDGQPYAALPEGRFRAWTGSRWSLKPVPLSLQALDVAPQDLLTADDVPLRIKPAVTVRVVDPVAVLREPDWPNQVYLTVQLALRELVTARTLDALLSEREALGAAILEKAVATLPPSIGMAIVLAAVKDVVLPGEVKDLLNRVTLARKEAEAMSVKRREETAATRQLANTARLLENNPVLLRLKELEALSEIAGKIERITLVGSGEELTRTVLLSDLAKAAPAPKGGQE